MSRQRGTKPLFAAKRGDELSLSSATLLDLLRAVLNRGVPFRFQAKGLSMWPFIKDGDVITVCPLKDQRLLKGDIVAFIHPGNGRLAVHRIMRERAGGFDLKGDNVMETDGIVRRENILGVVSRIERHGKPVAAGIGRWKALIAFLSRCGLFSMRPGLFIGKARHFFARKG